VLRIGRAQAPQQRADASREFFRCERLGHVVVGARLETSHHVVGVAARGDHDDGHAALGANLTTQLEAVDAGEHDVDQHHVGRVRGKERHGVLAGRGLVDGPAFVFERQTHRRADALVIFDGKNARAHDDSS